MTKFFVLVFVSVLSLNAWGHGGKDPLVELQKNEQSLAQEQAMFSTLKVKREQIESLESQLRYLQKDALLLRNLMATEYPHVREKMSRYKVDYFQELSDSLRDLERTLKQATQISPD